MFKKTLLTLAVGAFIFGAAALLFAQDVGNKVCPVSGEEINESMKVTYEYEGKVYNFCCASCIDEFKKDPEKYIKKVEEEKSKAPQAAEEGQADHMHH